MAAGTTRKQTSKKTPARSTKQQATRTRNQAARTKDAAVGTTKEAARTTKQAARTTKEAAQVAGRQAGQTGEEAQRTVSAMVRDGAYAVVGLGDSTVERLRHASQRAEQLRRGVPKAVQAIGPRARSLAEVAPSEIASAFGGLVSTAGEEFDSYAQRGRSLVGAVRRGRPTGRAIEQVRTARSQVKAARTSVSKAVDETVDAASAAADKVGAEGRGNS